MLLNYCGGASAALRGAHSLAYLQGMSRSLRAVRLAYAVLTRCGKAIWCGKNSQAAAPAIGWLRQ